MVVLAAVAGAGIAGALWLIASGVRPAVRGRGDLSLSGSAMVSWFSRGGWRRLALAAVGALVGLVLLRWPVAAFGGGVAGWFVPLPGGRVARRQLEARTEAIAQWCEMLRDTAGTARGLEGMLVATARSAPAPIRPQVTRMAARLEHEPLGVVLDGLADDLAHPIGDLVVTALRLAATSGSRRVRSVLDQLAASARRSASMRRRVDVARARPRSTVRLVAVIIAGFVAALMIFARDYLEPYSTPLGQLVLAGIGVYWALGFWWMARLGRVADVSRFLATKSDQATTSSAGPPAIGASS